MGVSRIVVLAYLLGSAAWAADESEIYVRIQDYSTVSPKTRAGALVFAQFILGKAGVSLVWLDCSPSLAGATPGRCKQGLTAQDIILRLMWERMASAIDLGDHCLGYAIVPTRGLGTYASVFVDKTRITAAEARTARSVVLGHAIAHEIAHLLIGKPEHTSQGLMKGNWSGPELLRAGAIPMELSAEEKLLVARNLRQRQLRARAAEGQLARTEGSTDKPGQSGLVIAHADPRRTNQLPVAAVAPD